MKDRGSKRQKPSGIDLEALLNQADNLGNLIHKWGSAYNNNDDLLSTVVYTKINDVKEGALNAVTDNCLEF